MRNIFASTAFFVILTLAFAMPVFANDGSNAYQTNVKEELAVVDDWVAPHANGNPLFGFYKNRAGLIRIQNDSDAWTHTQFIYDPEKSEYLISGLSGGSGTARLVRSKGKPDKLTVSGKFLDNAGRWVEFEYELVRKADAKKAGSSLPAGEYSIRKPEPHWMNGKWKTRSGTPMEASVSGNDGTPLFFMLKVVGGQESGDDIDCPVDLSWEESKKAFRMWNAGKAIREGQVVLMNEQTYGYIWPSSGEDADSETLRIEFYSGKTFEAVLEREKMTLAGLPEETLNKLRGTWVSKSGLKMKIVLGKSPWESSIHMGDTWWRLDMPQWDTELSKIVFFCANPAWAGTLVKGPDGMIYGKDRDFRLCTAELSKDEKTLTLYGVHGYNSFEGPSYTLKESDEPVPFTSVLVKGNKNSKPRGDYVGTNLGLTVTPVGSIER